MDTYESIIMDFVKQRFGSVVGKMLFSDRLKKMKIKSFKSLDQKAKVKFTEGLLHQILDKFQTKQEIDATLLSLNLRFSVIKSVDKVTMLLNKTVTMQPFEVKFETNTDAKTILEKLKENAVCFPISLSGLVEAKALFFLTKENGMALANIMMSLLGLSSPGEQIDDVKESAIREFINILIPAALDAISDTLNAKIASQNLDIKIKDMPKYVDGIMKQIDSPAKDQKPIGKIFLTESNMKIGDEPIDFVVLVLIESESISSAFGSSGVKKEETIDGIDLNKIKVNMQMDRKLAIIQILNQFKINGAAVVNEVMEACGLKSLDKIGEETKKEFIDQLISRNFAKHSSSISKFIRDSCARILQLP